MLALWTEQQPECCYHEEFNMGATPKPKSAPAELAALLAERLSERLAAERIVPRFVDSYVVEHGRYGLQVHAPLYRDLLTLLGREALLAISARTLEIARKGVSSPDRPKIAPMKRKDATVFRQKYVAALTRRQRWNAADAWEFQSDLRMYEEILARDAAPERRRKPFEAANHPFVDRCAFLLDSSFLEKARLAASRALTDLQALTTQIMEEQLGALATQKHSSAPPRK
jgi:hypothetical protein